jgi:hypothetical protein
LIQTSDWRIKVELYTCKTAKTMLEFQPSRVCHQGVLIPFMSRVNKISGHGCLHLNMYLDIYIWTVDPAQEMYQYSMRMAP